ncbi:MAG: hypothetical protein R3C10_26840 [Pirellulales bacterium]
MAQAGIAVLPKSQGQAHGATANDFAKEPEDYVIVFVPKMVTRFLLKDTAWAGLDIGQILRRVPGAESVQRRIAGKKASGVALPFGEFAQKHLDLDGGQ